jgi:hypothetical protein
MSQMEQAAEGIARPLQADVVSTRVSERPDTETPPEAVQEASSLPAPSRRTPDVESSRKRLSLRDTLARELATLKRHLTRHTTAEELKKKYPTFDLWTHLPDADLAELVKGVAFTPKAYAENLTLQAFGITSRETLKKDRKKLRRAERLKA